MTRTVKVRIAVVVDETGDWSAVGYPTMRDDRDGIADCLNGLSLRWFWLEAELPLPETATVTPSVEEAPPHE